MTTAGTGATDGALTLHAHPFSSYSQKVLVAFYERSLPFVYRSTGEPGVGEELQALWPLGKFPLLVAGAGGTRRVLPEATIIIEYLDLHHAGGVRLIPGDPDAALEVRLWDRVFDNYVMDPMQRIVAESLRPADARDPHGVASARSALDAAYRLVDQRMADRAWAAADRFTLADAAAAPALLYADWVHPIPAEHGALRGYRKRLLRRPSYARALDEARPFRPLFPPGAPLDRD